MAAAFGLLLVGAAIATIWPPTGVLSIEQYLEALVVGGLGLDILASAARNRRPLVLRTGPSP